MMKYVIGFGVVKVSVFVLGLKRRVVGADGWHTVPNVQ